MKVVCRSSLVRWSSHADLVDCLFSFLRDSLDSSRSGEAATKDLEGAGDNSGCVNGGDGRDDSAADYQISAFPAVRGVLVERRKAGLGGWISGRRRAKRAMPVWNTPQAKARSSAGGSKS